jgi:prepilin-type N-terminal cleavage/methylation domain-containing protein
MTLWDRTLPACHGARQQGFTLLELLVVLGALSLVTGVTLMAIYQLLNVPAQGNARLAIDADFRTANLWLMRDGNESQSFTPGGTCGVFYTGAARNISYTYSYLAGTLNRTDSRTGSTIGVAHHVASPPNCESMPQGQLVTVTFTSSSGNVSSNAIIIVALRVR